jgi:hypothetical protein
MSGPKRNPDKINTIGVVVVGICGAVLVYVSIVALQAFYMNDTSEIQQMADYGGQETSAKTLKADQIRNITQSGKNQTAPGAAETFRIPIDGEHGAVGAIQLIARDVKTDPTHLIPALPPSTKSTIEPIFGRPKLAPPPAPAPAGGATEGSGAGSSAAATGSAAPMTSTAGAAVPGSSTTTPTAGSPTGTGSAAPKGHAP